MPSMRYDRAAVLDTKHRVLSKPSACGQFRFRTRNVSNPVFIRTVGRFSTVPGVLDANSEASWNLLSTCSTYDPKLVEDPQLCRKLWDTLRIANPELRLKQNPNAPVVSLLLPPPNVTGSLHIGHALTCAVQDALARFYRMQGSAVVWVPGMDHAGIATQTVIERDLRSRASCSSGNMNNPRLELGRDAFVREAWLWKERQASRIREQLDSLGLSLDWNREFFTLSPRHSQAVTEAFVRLHESGLIYRASRIVSWCCSLQSVISDIEVDSLELRRATLLTVPGYEKQQQFGIMDYFAYPLAEPMSNSPKSVKKCHPEIVVATTRLETMLADTALAVHPEDPRYKHLIGREVVHPFCPSHRRLPIIADSQVVDPAKGTGVVKLSPGHSQVDWECAKTHGLPILNMLDSSGKVTGLGGEFAGLPRFIARERLVQRLTDLGLYRKREDIASLGEVTVLPICSRSGDVIEPIVREQWFLRTQEMAEHAMKAAQSGLIKFHPSYHKDVWPEWLSPGKHQDWCISRQLWWGHRIPAYRSKKACTTHPAKDGGTTSWVIARSMTEAEKQLSVEPSLIEQDPDVLDTWFSSALLPFSVFGWPDETVDLSRYYPLRLLETGQDILFFWVARMVMLALQLTKVVPFKEVVLHGLVCDSLGQKMSKSKGNVVDPMDLVHGIGTLSKTTVGPAISVIGADALRASLLSCTLSQPKVTYSQEMALDMRKFCNKIWQTARFLLMRLNRMDSNSVFQSPTENAWRQIADDSTKLSLADRWLIGRLSTLVRQINSSWAGESAQPNRLEPTGLEPFNFSFGVNQLRLWWMEDLCSVYLEILKFQETTKTDRSDVSLRIALTAMETALYALHPIMPHVTEVIWQELKFQILSVERQSIALQPFPAPSWFPPSLDFSPLVDDQMKSLLSLASTVKSWRPLLRRSSVERSNESSLYLFNAEEIPGPEEVEVLTALTRVPCVTDAGALPVHRISLKLSEDSPWQLVLSTESFDLLWTQNELQQRVDSLSKRRAQLVEQESKNDSEQHIRARQQKILSLDERLSALAHQLHAFTSRY
ncbi:Valine--tRNA ligase [Clonorchis sinensis]|uniref:valine--tRNA ligase n=1 Tax=Clonorchis sinensis TaxID=79923 RepID=A0A8T1MX33_CLOSI|nr:Valine--tRNA ligase [Clonorchis sinensis]